MFLQKDIQFCIPVGVQRELLGYEFLGPVAHASPATVYVASSHCRRHSIFCPSPFNGSALSQLDQVNSSANGLSLVDDTVFNVRGLSDSANLVLFYEKWPGQIRGASTGRQGFLGTRLTVFWPAPRDCWIARP